MISLRIIKASRTEEREDDRKQRLANFSTHRRSSLGWNHYLVKQRKMRLIEKMEIDSDQKRRSYVQNSRYEQLSSADDAVTTDAVVLGSSSRSPPSITPDAVVALCCAVLCCVFLSYSAIRALQRNYFMDVKMCTDEQYVKNQLKVERTKSNC